ncbi:MAG TPA: FxsA family protein [Micromonosporaceae bacterium]
MSRRVRVPLALLAVVLAETVVFSQVGGRLGFGWAAALVLAGSLLGLSVLKREGLRAWRGLRAAVDAGRPPGRAVTDGLVGLAAGLLLAVPGLATGVVGLVLMVPPVRGLARRAVERLAQRRVSSAVAGSLFGPRRVRVWAGRPDQADGVLDGEVVEPRH